MADKKIPELTQRTARVLSDMVPIEHDPSGTPETQYMLLKDLLRESATELTISAGAVTFTQLNHKLQPQSGTADDLDTINGTSNGQSGTIYVSDFGTDTITIKHNTGNILCVGDADIELSNGCVFWFSNGTKVFISGGGGGGAAATGGDKYPMEFRLTLESNNPVSTSDQTAKTTMYCTPYKGNQIALYDGVSAWTTYTSAQFSLVLGTLTSGLPYDVFCYNNSGTPTLEFTAWTNGTTRATALTTQNGVYVKSGATTRRYLGTFYTTSTTATEDSDTKRFLYNYYNRVARNMNKYVSGTHTYTTASWRQWNSDTSTKIEFVIGVVEDAEYLYIGGDAYGGSGYVAFGLNTTSSGSSPSIRNANASQVEMGQTRAYAPSLGYQYIAAVEYGGSGFTMNAITIGGFVFA